MATISTMAVIVLATKLTIAGLSTVGIASGMNYFSKKMFKFKKGAENDESDDDSTGRFRRNIE